MKVDDIKKDLILNIFQELNKLSSKLSGGNCGMVAYAICKICAEHYKINPKMGLICNKNDKQDTVCQLLNVDANIYHIFIEHNNRMYDETGIISNEYLLALAEEQYGDSDPDYFSDIEYNEPCILQLIRNDTNWDTSWESFYKTIKNFIV